MTKETQRSAWFLLPSTVLMGMMLVGSPVSAQQQPGQAPYPSQQPPATRQAPDQTQPETQGPQDQTFVGTIVKTGDKFMLQDTAGKSWDIDHQELVKKFEGKQVRVTGTLDADGKTIHMK